MTKKLFTERDIQILSNNPYIKSVSQKGILIRSVIIKYNLRNMVSYLCKLVGVSPFGIL